MDFIVQLLGTNSALPSHGRFPTAQYIQVDSHHFLIDCGEGTQIQMSKYKVKRNKISHIFISHLHGDHLYGLPGLLGSFGHNSRNTALTIYGPPGVKEFIEVAFRVSQARINYPIDIQELDPEEIHRITISETVHIDTFPLNHRVPNLGYKITHTPNERKIKKEELKKHNLTIDQILEIKNGEDIILDNGIVLANEAITHPLARPKSYAFCSDTKYDEKILPYIDQVDLLYHETTYLDGLEKEAEERMHSTLGQAIRIAQLAGAKRLMTGHYSSRYKDLELFRKAAADTPVDVIVGEEGNVYKV